MSNTFRKEYRKLSDAEQALVDLLKDQAEAIELTFNRVTSTSRNCREMALARTKLEESVMWAVKGITG